jgi:hypothetical protein
MGWQVISKCYSWLTLGIKYYETDIIIISSELTCSHYYIAEQLLMKDGNSYLRLRTMSYTIYAAKFEQTIYMYFYDGKVSRIDGASVTIMLNN